MTRRWAAPGRINLIGEHVDYAGGLCLPFATQHRTVVAGKPRADGSIRIRSLAVGEEWHGRLDDVGPGRPAGWAGYAAGVPWALAVAGHLVPGMDLVIERTVPLGSGMSSSAALCCAVALAVDGIAGLGLAGTDAGRDVLAAAARRAENDVVGAPTGGLDQQAVLHTQAGHALLLDCADGTRRQIPLLLGDFAILVIDTRVRHDLADGGYADRRRAVEAATAALGMASLRRARESDLHRIFDPIHRRGARHVITEIDRVRRAVAVLEANRPDELGPLLDASHASLRDDLEVSCPELDLATATARQAGALGARMIGGGFGGSAIALVPRSRAQPVGEAVEAAFRHAGFTPPDIHLTRPSAGAGPISGSADV